MTPGLRPSHTASGSRKAGHWCVFVFKGSFVSQGAHLGALRSCFQHLAPGCAGRKPARSLLCTDIN